MPHVPGLRSCYAKVGRLVYFGRMLDKILLHAAGQLPAVYQANLGDSQFFVLDGRCCRFHGVRNADLRDHALAGGTDEDVLAGAQAHGTPRTAPSVVSPSGSNHGHPWPNALAPWREILPRLILF